MRRQWQRWVQVSVQGVLAGAAAGACAQVGPTSAANAAEDFCAGKLSSEKMVSAALARAKERADLNAFVTLDEAGALAAAQRADAGKGHARCKPLSGVPIVIKDNIEVARLPTTGGTPALKGYVPKADAPVVKKLRDAGAIVLGKTNMHELAFGISGYNPAYNTGPQVGVRNAYDARAVAGGSSSGTGAALGARIVMAGLGTDTGGSVRIPCAFNGCASLRPTVGRYSQKGILPISHTRDTAGPMALAMGDVELLDRVISGAKRAEAADLKTVRLGLVKDFLANTDADTQAAFDAALAKARAAGVTVVDVQMPKLMELNGAVSFPIALYEAYDDVVKYLQQHRHRHHPAQAGRDHRQPRRQGHLPGPGDPAQAARAQQHGDRCQAGLRRGNEDVAPGFAEAVCRHFQAAQARRAGLSHRAQGGDGRRP